MREGEVVDFPTVGRLIAVPEKRYRAFKRSEETLAKAETVLRKLEDLSTELVRRSAETTVDAAVAQGRIDHDDRDEWIRRFEQAPEVAAGILTSVRPDPEYARRELAHDPAAQALWDEWSQFGGRGGNR
jgi:hypothetical protein